jgi:hypothetical protein
MKTPAEPGNERLTALTALPGSLPGCGAARRAGASYCFQQMTWTTSNYDRRPSATLAAVMR